MPYSHSTNPFPDSKSEATYVNSPRMTTPYQHELDDLDERLREPAPTRPRGQIDDAYLSWRHATQTQPMPGPVQNSKTRRVYASVCCGSPLGIIAWLLLGAAGAAVVAVLLVKAFNPNAFGGHAEPSTSISTTVNFSTSTLSLSPTFTPMITTILTDFSTETATTVSTTTQTATSEELSTTTITYTPPSTAVQTETETETKLSTTVATSTATITSTTTTKANAATVTSIPLFGTLPSSAILKPQPVVVTATTVKISTSIVSRTLPPPAKQQKRTIVAPVLFNPATTTVAVIAQATTPISSQSSAASSAPPTTGTLLLFGGNLDCVNSPKLCSFALVSLGIAGGVVLFPLLWFGMPWLWNRRSKNARGRVGGAGTHFGQGGGPV